MVGHRRGRGDAAPARDANLQFALGDFNLGQAGFAEDVSQLADQLGVDALGVDVGGGRLGGGGLGRA